MSTLTTNKLGATVGAEVLGVDAEQLLWDETLPAACMEALQQNGVLVFRSLHIGDEAQIVFSKRMDDVGKAEPAAPPRIFKVTLDPAKNPAADYLRGTFEWHIDGASDDIPTKASMLSAHVLATTGGETEFASTYAAYDDLSGDERTRCEGLRVVHSFERSQRLVNPDPSEAEVAAWRAKPDKEHPLVWRHGSGRRSLVLGATAARVVGMDPDDGASLLADLQERATSPDRVYRHHWAEGDLVIWDNTGVMHRACPYDPSSSRELHRTTLSGDEPIR